MIQLLVHNDGKTLGNYLHYSSFQDSQRCRMVEAVGDTLLVHYIVPQRMDFLQTDFVERSELLMVGKVPRSVEVER